MNLFSEKNVKTLLKKHEMRPLKGLGQNFLISKAAVKKIIESAELKPEDVILEIGPGMGALTIELAKKAKEIIAVEKDLKMVEVLKELLERFNVRNVKIIPTDILKINLKYYMPNTKYKIVANLPFYLTAPVIRKFLELIGAQPQLMVLGVQKEMGQRICAKPPNMNILAVSVQFYAKSETIGYVSKKSFWPQPKVDSAIIRISPLINANGRLADADLFFRIVKTGFSQPRKQLVNNLSRLRRSCGGQAKKINREKINNWLVKNGIQPTQRAGTLTVENWLNLTKSFKSH